MSARRRSTPLWAAVAVLAASVIAAACGGSQAASDITPTSVTLTASPTASATATPIASPTATARPLSHFDPDLHQLVSKQYALPADYVPPNLVTLPARWAVPEFAAPVVREVAADPLLDLLEAADADGLQLRVRSSYRSYATQAETFRFWVDYLGEEQARRESAEAGHSEHQLGTTVDFASPAVGWELIAAFADTDEGRWLAARAWRYGFALSYPRDAEEITGYVFEPWHYRYIGRPAAAGWHASGLTLIEYLLALHGDDAPAPAATATPAPGATATPSATATPAASATATPSATARPSATASPTATASGD